MPGEMQVEVQYGQQCEHLDLTVVAGEGAKSTGSELVVAHSS